MNNNKLAKALEIVWLTTSILCAATAVHLTINEGLGKSYVFMIFSIIAFAIYTMRKRIRKSNKKES